MNSFLYAGHHWDLSITYLDCTGVEWHHTGIRSDRGFPLMQSTVRDLPGQRPCGRYEQAPVPLDEVHEWHGPLVPMAPSPSHLSAWLTHPTGRTPEAVRAA